MSQPTTSGVADGPTGSATACARTPPYQGTRPGPFGMKIFTPERAGRTPQSASAQPPEQVLVLDLARVQDLAVGGYDLEAGYVVAGRPN